jgi:enoyl-CoA hydratase/carnithine racemase
VKYKTVIVSKKEHIATITLNRPEKLNALNPQLVQDYRDAVIEVDGDDDVRAIIITGAGRAFSAGMDYKENFQASINELKEKGIDPSRKFSAIGKGLYPLEKVRVPVIVAINGYAMGAAFTAIALRADIRIASEEAKIQLTFSRIGIMIEAGSTYLLSRLIGMGKACELAFTARTVDAKEALELRLVNQVVPADKLMETTWEMAKAITAVSPMSNRLAKRALYLGLKGDMDTAEHFEEIGLSFLGATADYEEAVKAFLEKRAPDFKNR